MTIKATFVIAGEMIGIVSLYTLVIWAILRKPKDERVPSKKVWRNIKKELDKAENKN